MDYVLVVYLASSFYLLLVMLVIISFTCCTSADLGPMLVSVLFQGWETSEPFYKQTPFLLWVFSDKCTSTNVVVT